MTDNFDRVGKGSLIAETVEVLVTNRRKDDPRGIFIGDDCQLYPRNRIVLGDMSLNKDANFTIGDHVKINAGGYFSGEGGLSIGDHVLIGPNVCILSAGHEYEDPEKFIIQQPLTYGRIRIEKDVWIGASSVILPGVTIEQGAVIGAGSVICKDVPPYAVVVGNPGRVIRYRNRSSKTGVLTSSFYNFINRVKTLGN